MIYRPLLDELDTIEFYQQSGKAHYLSEITLRCILPMLKRRKDRLCPKVDLSKGLEACSDDHGVYFNLLQIYAENAETEQPNEYLEQKSVSRV